MQDGSNIVKKMKGVFAFKVKGLGGKEGVWIVDAKNGSGSVKFGGNGKETHTHAYTHSLMRMRACTHLYVHVCVFV